METNTEQATDAPATLLYNQRYHISEGIRQGEEFGRLRCIPTNPDKHIWELTKQQKSYVRQVGLHHLAEIERIVIDHALITALVERWRPETNSFHFPSGEATITLEDVAYLYGSLVSGRTANKWQFGERSDFPGKDCPRSLSRGSWVDPTAKIGLCWDNH